MTLLKPAGGFLGVDVFFVISGFVITQLLQRAFASGSFQFRDFYARRIRRLVPGLIGTADGGRGRIRW